MESNRSHTVSGCRHTQVQAVDSTMRSLPIWPCPFCERDKLREVLRGVIMAWDRLYSTIPYNEAPFAEDLEFGPVSQARIAYDTDWYRHKAFEPVTDDRSVENG